MKKIVLNTLKDSKYKQILDEMMDNFEITEEEFTTPISKSKKGQDVLANEWVPTNKAHTEAIIKLVNRKITQEIFDETYGQTALYWHFFRTITNVIRKKLNTPNISWKINTHLNLGQLVYRGNVIHDKLSFNVIQNSIEEAKKEIGKKITFKKKKGMKKAFIPHPTKNMKYYTEPRDFYILNVGHKPGYFTVYSIDSRGDKNTFYKEIHVDNFNEVQSTFQKFKTFLKKNFPWANEILSGLS